MRIGIDIGGTNIAAALVGEGGGIVKSISAPTNADGGAEAVTGGILRVCERLLEGLTETPRSVGIGVPGVVNAETGEVMFTPNLPLSGVNITRGIGEKLGCPVFTGNDANCAALGEAYAGALRDAQSGVFITLGTGVGGGIILNKRLYTGSNGLAGEIGHMVISMGGHECGCGRRGCFEAYASATGLVRTARELADMYEDSILREALDRLDSRAVFDAMRAGDRAARLAVDKYIKHLAAGIANLINMFAPETVCIGGGVSNAWDCISEPLRAAVDAEKYARFSPEFPQTRIIRAELGGDAGVIGAAVLGDY